MVVAVRELDKEMTDHKVELTIHGAAIKQLLEDRAHSREHAWQIKALIATVALTQATQIFAAFVHHP